MNNLSNYCVLQFGIPRNLVMYLQDINLGLGRSDLATVASRKIRSRSISELGVMSS